MTAHLTPPLTVAELCDRIGRKHLQRSLGVGRTAISNACIDGRFPAKWFRVVKGECEQRGLALDDDHFAFVVPDALSTICPTDPPINPDENPHDPASSDGA